MRARFGFLAVLLAACASAPRGHGDPAPAIRSVLDVQVAAWNRGDLDAFMDGYWQSPDLVFTSGGNVQRGWQTTLDRYRASYGGSPETMGRLSFSDLEIHPLADGAAWVLGRWRLDYPDRDLGGVFSLVFREVDGRWVIVHDHTSLSP